MTIPLIDGVTLHPLVLPARADAGPTPEIRAYADLRNRSLREISGRDDADRSAEELLPVLYSDADESRQQWRIVEAGETLGLALLNIGADDGGRMAITTILLLREHWGRGIGTAVLAEVERAARAAGVQNLHAWVEHPASDEAMLPAPTGFGAVPHDHIARFLQRHGFTLEQVERVSVLAWDADAPGRISRLRADAEAHAADYEVVQWRLPTPPEHVAGYAWMKSRMSTDVPAADLDLPEEVWDADRVTRHDARYLRRGSTVLVTAARHRATGELCAYNELSIGQVPTRFTDQEDTLVLAAHRGHRLGMLVKAAGLQRWREEHADSPGVITYNAEENRPMLDINEALGFAPIAYEGAWKKVLR